MEASKQTASSPRESSTSIAWASGALLLTVIVGAAAKILGVLVAPGMRGIASERAMVATETVSATLGYTFAALLVALICGGSFELARARRIHVASRGTVVAISGLIVALASPAVVQRLHPMAAIMLAVVASVEVKKQANAAPKAKTDRVGFTIENTA